MSLLGCMKFNPAEQGNVGDQDRESNKQAASDSGPKVAEVLDKGIALLGELLRG